MYYSNIWSYLLRHRFHRLEYARLHQVVKLSLGPLPFGPIELRLCWEQNPRRRGTCGRIFLRDHEQEGLSPTRPSECVLF
jgi:hypothetical protein